MKEALKLALDLAIMHHSDGGYAELRLKVRQLAKEALAQPDYRAVKTYHEGKPVYVSQPEQEPVLLNGLTEAETNSSASVMGLIKHMQPEQEPVFLIYDDAGGWIESNESDYSKTEDVNRWLLYTAPPKRPWVGLTDEEIEDCMEMSIQKTCRAIEAKLKEKNT